MGSHLVMTPSHICDPGIAVAAVHSGELGILDLGYSDKISNALHAVGGLELAARGLGRWGVRWDCMGLASRSPKILLNHITSRVPIIIIGGLARREFKIICQEMRQMFEEIILEVTTLEMAEAAQKAGCDGIVIKGNEAGGYTGVESAFILCQQLYGKVKIPYWVWGGMGLHTISAVRLAGAEGGVLCEQLWLTRESPFSMEEKKVWQKMDGSETTSLSQGEIFFRLYSRNGRKLIHDCETELAASNNWYESMARLLQANSSEGGLIPCGQDIGMAAFLSEQFGSVRDVLRAVENGCQEHLEMASIYRSFSENSALAKTHGTRFPIIQGPMANISDVAGFSLEIIKQGGLPFIALSALPGLQIKQLLSGIKDELKSRPWGVGILGFLPAGLRKEQFDAIKLFSPPFAIIAGGRPTQAEDFEAEGISTYLHIPTPTLLSQFIRKGARKFIFEGSECGGHVGPLSSFILWESAVNTVLSSDLARSDSPQILFAGGIHDALSSAMVQTLAAPLAKSGFKLGMIMGSAYLFTEESVKYAAITPEYQKQALACTSTRLLRSGSGHASSCMETPFVEKFYTQKQKLALSGKSSAEITKELELMNIGRLKLASKGILTTYQESHDKDYATHIQIEETKVDEETQRKEGLFMIGQVARLHDSRFTIKELHEIVTTQSFEFLKNVPDPVPKQGSNSPKERFAMHRNEDIAIVGMACFLPEANNIIEYWHNIINQVCAIKEIPENRWKIDEFFDANRRSSDKSYSKWGGFLKDILFDPTIYAMAPKSLLSIDATQLVALKVAHQALEDAGFHKSSFPRKNTSVIFAAGGFSNLGMDYGCRVLADYFSNIDDSVPKEMKQKSLDAFKSRLPEWSTDSFPGVLTNVIAGRISNRFDLGGMNFTVDAACASSFAALDTGLRQLRTYTCDAALVGAVDLDNHPLGYVMFSRAQVLSPTGESRPLDDGANGIVLSEGAGAVVLKRLSDAKRDKDRIYAVIKGMGGASDGRNTSLVAPNSQGQLRAMKAAYEDAGISPESVELLELHGTGTTLGDRVEMQSCTTLLKQSNVLGRKHCAVGSVKSMIGHTKVSAGLASLIKTSLALNQKILPPTIGVDNPNKKFDFKTTPFYINSETRPWLLNTPESSRKAGLSCFGFGGSNFHLVMEEFQQENDSPTISNMLPRDSEIFSFTSPSREKLKHRIDQLQALLGGVKNIDFSQLAYSIFLDSYHYQPKYPDCRLNIVASSLEDLKNKLNAVQLSLDKHKDKVRQEVLGIYYSEDQALNRSSDTSLPVCFLYPGQGSQRVNMLRDLVVSMPQTYTLLELADQYTEGGYDIHLSDYIFPEPVFSNLERRNQQKALNQTQVAQPAMGVVNLICHDILSSFGIRPNMVAGHSYGEYVALCTAGVLSRKDLIQLSESRGKMIAKFSNQNTGTMAAVQADAETTSRIIEKKNLNVTIANYNSPVQNVISGPIEDIDRSVEAFKSEKITIKKIPVTAAFHTEAMDSISKDLKKTLKKISLKKPRLMVFSNGTSQQYPEEIDKIREYISNHSSQSVRFEEMIKNMYQAGARLFIEVGPGQVLTRLVQNILGDVPHAAVPISVSGHSGWLQLHHLLAKVKSMGVPVDLQPCFDGRGLLPLSIEDLFKKTREQAIQNPMVWRIFGGRAEPLHTSHEKIIAPSQKQDNTGSIEQQKNVEKQERQASDWQHPLSADNTKMDKEFVMAHHKLTFQSPENTVTDREILNVLDQCNKTMAHLFEMQKEQHRTTQQFLQMQERMIQATLQGRINSQLPNLPAAVNKSRTSEMQEEPLNHSAPPVPPSPTLPSMLGNLNMSEAVAVDTVLPAKPALATDTVSAPAAVKNSEQEMNSSLRGNIVLPSITDFRDVLLTVTSEHTGFPEGMLDLAANMETELGVDSIKKLEIFSSLDERYHLTENADEEIFIEELAVITTLGGIVEWYEKKREEFMKALG